KIEAKRKLPEFQPGDTVRVLVRVTEGSRTRVQAYEGVCIARSGSGFQENFTVRKISYGEGVERVFPVYSPLVESVDVVRRGKVRRAKLYYLRDRRGKSARIVENTGTRARKLNDAERQAIAEEKARLEAEKVAAAQALAAEKAAAEAAEAAKADARKRRACLPDGTCESVPPLHFQEHILMFSRRAILAGLAAAALTPAVTFAADLPDLGGKTVVVVTENAYPPLQFVDPKSG